MFTRRVIALTPGGSSGGESSLIAVRGSPMGIGTDIGGSIVSDKRFECNVRLDPEVEFAAHPSSTRRIIRSEGLSGPYAPFRFGRIA